MPDGNVAVIGGGPCGCSAAWELARAGYGVTLVEERECPGGMASYLKYGDNIYEFGTHVFHTDRQDLLARIKDLMGAELLEFERGSKIHIKFRGRYFVYPLQGANLLANLSPFLTLKAILSFLGSFIRYDCLRLGAPRNTEDYLIQKFGRVLYEIFFRDYSHKTWGVPCSELDASFGAQRIPRSDIFSLVKSVLSSLGLSRLVDSHPLSESVIGKIYYAESGICRIFEKMAGETESLGGTMLTGASLEKIVVENNRVRSVILRQGEDKRELDTDFVVTTIPLPVLVRCLPDDTPREVLAAGENLRYRSIALTGMLVSKPQVRPGYFTYYQNLTFNRLSEPKNHGLRVAPDNHSLIIAETVCDYDDQAYRGDAEFRRAVTDDLVGEDLVKKHEIAESHHYAWRYAYPIYLTGYRKHLDVILSYLDTIPNIHTTGRNGTFNYVNMHVAMQMGLNSVEPVRSYMGDAAHSAAPGES
ncbi:FAD-dependent oxidoreductase [bacterium]|nr:FAD-dependent oxidoreductase [bacterium]